MIYLLYGTLDALINDYINKIIKKENIADINISKYNEDDLIANIIEDASTISLFDDKKLIIVNNELLFSSKKSIDTTELEKYIENYNPNTILIFTVFSDTVDTRRKLYKIIKEKGKVEEFNKITNINSYVRKLFNGYNINYNTINLFIKRVGNDLNSLSNEAEKIKIYKIDDKIITDKDIIDCTHEKIDINIFKFIDNIINKNKKESITTYKEMLKVGEEPIKIIVMLANQFRLMYQAKILTSKGYTEEDIANLLHSKKYPVHLAIEKGYRYTSDTLLKHLEELADLDIKIKSGEIDKNLALELFLLRI